MSVDSAKTLSCEFVESIYMQCRVTLSECQEVYPSNRAQDYCLG